ncbi:MAG: AMP-binding protein [Burkholderiales bacterium]
MISRNMLLPTTNEVLLRALARYPDRVAFRWDGGQLTYRATADLIGRMQQVYASAGLARGGRVALLMSNLASAWCAGMAALCGGMAVSWLHPMGSLEDHLFQLRDFDADALVVDTKAFGPRGGELAAAAPDLRAVYTLGPSTFGRDLLAAAEKTGSHAPMDLAHATDLSYVAYTGGTTGRSKGVARDHASYAHMLISILADFELPATPHFLAVAPISHVAGSKVLPVLTRGGSVYLMNGFDPQRVFDIVASQHINVMLLVPTMVYALLDHPGLAKADLSSLELLLYGASPMVPSRLREGLERFGPVFSQLYGQTEGYPLTLLRRSDHDLRHPELFASCGMATTGTLLRVLDDASQPVPVGEIGELCARSPSVMQHYLNQPELTAETLKDGWLHTGDMAYADDRGYLYIVDRKKDMVVTGGFNVYPRDVEDVIASHPAVAQVTVIGVPDPKWGEAVMAVVVCKGGLSVSGDELMQLVKARKGPVQAPKKIVFVDRLPLTGLGKVDKKALRAPYWVDQLRQVG